jgi:cell division ATPase FtsA
VIKKMKKTLKLALSLDQTKTTALAYEPRTGERPIVQAFCTRPHSIYSGVGVSSLQAAADTILEVVDEIESEVKHSFYEVDLTHSSPNCVFIGFTSLLSPSQEGVSQKDLEEIARLEAAGQNDLAHTTPPTMRDQPTPVPSPSIESLYYARQLPYILDRETITTDPLGLHAAILTRGTCGFRDNRALLANISASLHLAGLKIENWVPQPLASGLASTTAEERKHGVVSIDFGARLTQISVFKNNCLFFSKVIPYGGLHVTKDLATCIALPMAEAEDLKKTLVCYQDQRNREVPEYAQAIAEARVSEILVLIRSILKRTLGNNLLDYTVVLCGGGTALRGLLAEFKRCVHPLARTTVRYNVRGFSDLLEDPSLASLVGLCTAEPSLQIGSECFGPSAAAPYKKSASSASAKGILGKVMSMISR